MFAGGGEGGKGTLSSIQGIIKVNDVHASRDVMQARIPLLSDLSILCMSANYMRGLFVHT